MTMTLITFNLPRIDLFEALDGLSFCISEDEDRPQMYRPPAWRAPARRSAKP
jgi:hypothetical protein